MTFPVKVLTRVTAIEEAREISLKIDGPVYLYAVLEGGYYIANEKREYSNERLIYTFQTGEKI